MKMRNKKQNGLQTGKMKPNAINNCTIPLDTVKHVSQFF